MSYVLSAVVAMLLVAGQSLWKLGVERLPTSFGVGMFMSKDVFSFILSPFIIAGFVVYAVATLMYMFLLDKYDYSLIQSLVIPFSLMVAYLVASVFFKEKIALINIAGLGLITIGVILATRR